MISCFLPLARSRCCSLPRFSVTSRLPSGRKVIAHGWSKRLTSVAVKGRWSAAVAAVAGTFWPVASGPAALQAVVARIGSRPSASNRGVRVMGISSGRGCGWPGSLLYTTGGVTVVARRSCYPLCGLARIV
ncbi:hypothetical protein D3C72_1279990 [compost metagenome]